MQKGGDAWVMGVTLLLPVSRSWTREAVCEAIAASDVPRGTCLLVRDAPDVGPWADTLTGIGFTVTEHATPDAGTPPPDDRYERRERHARMRAFTTTLLEDSDEPLLILDDDTIVPPDVFARLSAAGPHATAVQVSRWGNPLVGVYRNGRPLIAGRGIEPVEHCGHYCLLTTKRAYRASAVHAPDECWMQPIPGLVADWDCVCGHLTPDGVLYPVGRAPKGAR